MSWVVPRTRTPRIDAPIIQASAGHDSQAYFPTSFTNLHSPACRVCVWPPTRSTTVSTWSSGLPTGSTMRPPSASCSTSGGGTEGPPAWEALDGTDMGAVHDGYASVTPLHLDLTHHRALAQMTDWEPALNAALRARPREPAKPASRAKPGKRRRR